MGVDAKADLIRGLGADVLVVPECRPDPRLATEGDVDFRWAGISARKGLGIFAFGGWQLTPLRRRGREPWCLPVAVKYPTGRHAFDLLGIWTVVGTGRPGYVRQFTRTLDLWQRRLARAGLVIAGDLNDSMRPSDGVPSANLDRLHAAGLGSAYHAHASLDPGAEVAQTLHWVGPGRVVHRYHCDFVFLSSDLLSRVRAVEVGSMEEWVDSGRSDHCPVVVTVAP